MVKKIVCLAGSMLACLCAYSANYIIGSKGLSMSMLETMEIGPGDTLSFQSGETFYGRVVLDNIDASSCPVVITSTGAEPAVIDAAGESEGILVRNSRGVSIRNLSLKADGSRGVSEDKDQARLRKMRCGILIEATLPGHYGDISLSDLHISDIFCEDKGFVRSSREVKTANGTQAYGWGIRIIGSRDALISGIDISDCNITNVSHTGIKITGPSRSIQDIDVSGNIVTYTGGPGIQMSGVRSVHVHNNTVDHSGSGDDSRKWGRGSGFWCWGASDILVERNSFTNAGGPADSAGAHIDYNCSDVVFQYNFSANNAGGFVEILGNNHNCAYRFNISVNDGYRVKGEDGAFQEGKTLWLSGYCGEKRKGPFNSYIYNNTIYVSKEIDAKIAIENTTSGALVANNIFYIEGHSSVVPGDQYNPEKPGESESRNVMIKNNLYVRTGILPDKYTDMLPLYGDPALRNPGGYMVSDYIPGNRRLVKRGMRIPKIIGDEKGLAIGLEVKEDFFGNPLGRPIIGAAAPVK